MQELLMSILSPMSGYLSYWPLFGAFQEKVYLMDERWKAVYNAETLLPPFEEVCYHLLNWSQIS